jgi:hypothetical protein
VFSQHVTAVTPADKSFCGEESDGSSFNPWRTKDDRPLHFWQKDRDMSQGLQAFREFS